MKKIVNFLNKNLILIVTCCVLLLSGCTGKKTETQAKTKITATFYPLYIMLMNITDSVPDVEISMLAPANTGCLHDYQLTTRDMKTISSCSILVANGAGMEDFMEKAVSIKKGSIITASEGYELVDGNAHIWVSPKGAVYEVMKIAEGLARLDEKNAGLYLSNAQKYADKLNSLSLKMHEGLDCYKGAEVITFHEAFPYFADEFNLVTAAVIERDAGEEPSAKEMNELIKLIKEYQAKGETVSLFGEVQYPVSAAEIISRETGLRVGLLDPAVTGELKKDSYIIAMEHNLKVLSEFLGKGGNQ